MKLTSGSIKAEPYKILVRRVARCGLSCVIVTINQDMAKPYHRLFFNPDKNLKEEVEEYLTDLGKFDSEKIAQVGRLAKIING